MNSKFIIQEVQTIVFSLNFWWVTIAFFIFKLTLRYAKVFTDIWLNLIILSSLIFWVIEISNNSSKIIMRIKGIEKHFDKYKKTKLYHGEN